VILLGTLRRLSAPCACACLLVSGCAWQGLNSLPLPGTPGRGAGSTTLHVELANVGSLESNSPVMMNDVVVGSVGKMTVRSWRADVEVSVRDGVVVPANVVAVVGQTSLLGSSHLELDPPPGVASDGAIPSGATIPLNRSSTYPSTEQTLSSLSVVLNSGGLGQIDEIIKQFSAAIGGRGGEIRDLISRLDTFVGTLTDQSHNIIATIDGLNRLAIQAAGQSQVIEDALQKFPSAVNVLIAERANLTTALDRLRVFSDTTAGVIANVKSDLVTNLQHLEPTLRGLADAGPTLGKGLQQATVFPYGQWVVDEAIKGDYANLFVTIDLTTQRLRSDLLAGTRFGRYAASLPAVVGEAPVGGEYTSDPLGVGAAPPPAPAPADPAAAPPAGSPTPDTNPPPSGVEVPPLPTGSAPPDRSGP
jgi:phospholipid/cholesterol/gamma-HCH transport system substrate-binding protein